MMSRREASRIARRMTAGVALAVTLAACGSSRLDGVPVDWPGFREPRLATAPSEPAQCPDLTGPYRIQGEFRTGERDASLDDLGRFLAWTLYLPGMGGGDSRAWNPAPGASVTFASDAQAWRALLRDGRGGKLEGRLPGAASPAGDLVDPARQQIMLASGCAQGRLWISAREDWRQHESQGVRRHVAMLRPEGGGLLLTVRRESDSIGMLLPWYSNDSRVSQYWFAPAGPR